MRKLHLHIGKMISGEFVVKKLNVLLMFQVNCPGCFMYAIPGFNDLHKSYRDQLGFLSLSTAFEDYSLNTEENTRLLLNKGELVGETRIALSQQGIEKLPYQIDFPVGMDAFLRSASKEKMISNICALNPNYPIWSEYDQSLLRKRILIYLNNQEKISVTFTANQFKGTPTVVLFNDQFELLDLWFGHQPEHVIVDTIEKYI